jgi:protein O-GlcNAc transferase
MQNKNLLKAEKLYHKATSLYQDGHIFQATELYKEILKLDKNNIHIMHLLSNAYVELGDYNNALLILKDSLRIISNDPITYLNLSVLSEKTNKLNDAVIFCDKAIQLRPDFVQVYSNRGNLLFKLQKYDEALKSCNLAIQLKSDYADAYVNKGNVLLQLKSYNEALDSYDKAIELKHEFADAYYNRGAALQELKRLKEALESYQRAISINPNYDFLLGLRNHLLMKFCDWDQYDDLYSALKNKIVSGPKSSPPFPVIGFFDDPSIQKRASLEYIDAKFPDSGLTNNCKASYSTKIKIGYYSADFRDHAVMHLIAEIFENHDRKDFELYAFSFGPDTHDAWQQRASRSFSKFINCYNKTDIEIAKLSQSLGIDIAIDLNGFTEYSRTGIFSNRAAPIQVNYLGYPGTMGAEYFDYIIADSILIPENSRIHYSEKVAYLPHCYQPNCRHRNISDKIALRSQYYLPESGIVFCSFNHPWKITPYIFSSWMKILHSVKNSVLWIMVIDDTAKRNLKKEAEVRGIDTNRLIFADSLPVEEHLNRLQLADIFLDTFPYGAHTTCSDALRMGLPVITMMGQSFASRVAGSLLTTIGLSELITYSQTEYENLAIRLATNPTELKNIKIKLIENKQTSPLFDSERYAKNIETLYMKMVQRNGNGEEPDHLFVD